MRLEGYSYKKFDSVEMREEVGKKLRELGIEVDEDVMRMHPMKVYQLWKKYFSEEDKKKILEGMKEESLEVKEEVKEAREVKEKKEEEKVCIPNLRIIKMMK